jgi:hypothetical protein
VSYYVETNSGKPLLARSKLTGNLLQIRTIEDATRIAKLAHRRSGQAIRVTRDPVPGEHGKRLLMTVGRFKELQRQIDAFDWEATRNGILSLNMHPGTVETQELPDDSDS